MTPADEGERQHVRFLLLYALAWGGGAIAYVPLLSLILPGLVTAMAGSEAVSWIAILTFVGAGSASVCNIAFGWASDLTGNRTGWIVAGLALSSLVLVRITSADDLPSLIMTLVLWQLGVNMMLAPMAAWAGDCVPDEQKGRLGGLLAIAPAMGALAGAIVTWPGLVPAHARLWVVAAMVVAAVLPVLLLGRPRRIPHLMEAPPPGDRQPPILGMWLARLLIQVSEAALFAFLLLWLVSLNAGFGESDAARLFGLVIGCSIPLALIAGRWADRSDRPILPLVLASLAAACGLAIMAVAQTVAIAIGGYVLFALAGAVFLALHAAQTLRVLPRPATRGRDLGVFNLTNTLPALAMPGIALALVPVFGFSGLFLALAMLALGSTACLIVVMRRTRTPRSDPPLI